MKNISAKCFILLRRMSFLTVVLALASIAVLTASVWQSSATTDNDRAAARRRFHARVRDGIGREVLIPRRGNSSGQIRAAVNSVANFIDRRSGVRLSGAAKNRLAEMEERALNGTSRRLTANELSNVIAATAVERLASLSDQDLVHVENTLRGFNAPNLPRNFNRDFKLPGGIVFLGTPSERNIARLRAVRDQLGTPAGDVFQGMTRRIVGERVQSRAQYLSESVPERFGNMWNVIDDEENRTADGGITPLQAILVAYSLVSDDHLSDSETSLNRRMRSTQESITEVSGEPYPNPSGHRAYGVNGYIFSSPLDLMLDEQTLNRLLDRIEERSAA